MITLSSSKINSFGGSVLIGELPLKLLYDFRAMFPGTEISCHINIAV
jgi:hypothetical protein